MNYNRLKAKGWSEQEITHLKHIALQHPRNHTLEHLSLWVMALLLAVGSVGIAVFLLPIIAFTSTIISLPVSLLLGICIGFLLTHALDTLGNKEHRDATMVLFILSFFWVWLSVAIFAKQFSLPISPILICAPYTLGMLIPYLATRRIHGTA